MHAAFLAAVRAAPADDTPRLVYADWLEENGDPEFAAAVRAEPHLARDLDRLRRLSYQPWPASPGARSAVDAELYARAAGWFLVRYPDLFDAPPGLSAPDLSADGPVPGERLARFYNDWVTARYRQVRDLREWAARQAAAVSTGDGTAFPSPPGDPVSSESQACLLYELTVRSSPAVWGPAAAGVAAAMREAGHPLARLPLTLLPVEREIPAFLPRYSGGGLGWSNPAPDDDARPLADETVARPGIETVDDLPTDHAARSAVRTWDGEIEARQVVFTRPVSADNVSAAAFRAAGVVSFGTAGERLIGRWVPPGRAFNLLFCAAQNGGAYSSGERSAYGRLAAWESLAALAGVPPGAGCDEVAVVAGTCLWVEFGDTDWFEQVAWDLGLVCVRPDRRTAVVLAATDTD